MIMKCYIGDDIANKTVRFSASVSDVIIKSVRFIIQADQLEEK